MELEPLLRVTLPNAVSEEIFEKLFWNININTYINIYKYKY